MRKHIGAILRISVLVVAIAFAVAVGCSWDIITKGNVSDVEDCPVTIQRDTVFIYVQPEFLGGDSLRFITEGGEIFWIDQPNQENH